MQFLRIRAWTDGLQFLRMGFWIRRAVRNIWEGPALDVGTGGGVCLSTLRGRGIFTVGIDTDLDRLRSKENVVQADACHLPFRDGIFKAVIFGMSLHHIRDHKHCLREAFRVLSEGGLLSIVDWWKTPPFHKGWKMPSPESVLRYVRQIGFIEIEYTKKGPVFLLNARKGGI